MNPEDFALAGMWYIVFLLSTTCHEAAHSLVALWGGDRTALLGGQVTLNPVPHMRREPWGMILVPLLSYFAFSGPGQGGWMFGWASAPYDLRWRMRYPQRAGLMALAGPGANLLLALLSFTLLVVGFQADVLAVPTDGFRLDRLAVAVEPGVWSGFATFFSILFSLNVVLCAFNLIPAPPLDGATAIGALLPPSAGRRWAELTLNPTVSMVSLLAAWFIFPRLVVGPALRWAVELLYSVA